MSDKNEILTERLVLRRVGQGDVTDIVRMDADPVVMRFMGGPADQTSRERWFRAAIRRGWPVGGGLWAVRDRADGRFLGTSGLFDIPMQSSFYGPQLYEIGYRFLQHAWGRGIATEAGRAVLDHGFRVMGLDPIVAVTNPFNFNSQRVLSKIGFRREGERVAYDLSLPFFVATRKRHEAMATRANGKGL